MMKMNKKVVLALLMVSLILFSSLVVLYPDNQNLEATASASVPKGEDYGYVLEIDTTTAGSWTVNDVKVWDGTGYTSAKNTTQYVLHSFWQFDENGLGPFNCFYAAINLVDYQIGDSSASDYNPDYLKEAPLSSVAGHVAYVLDPNCFTKTLAGFSYTAEKYNIMLVIPTVYWYSDSSTVTNYDFVFMSNNPDFFNIHRFSETISSTPYSFTSATKSSMIAYAHTYESSKKALNWSSGITYPYLALGVYEASQLSVSGKTCLVSQPSVTSSNNTTISNHRNYAGNNTAATGSQYTIPNWFNWNLYQLMSYTTIGCLDAQYMVGAGVSSGSALTTGGCTSWFTPTSYTTTTSHVCLYLEDAWGNRWEQIDSVCVDRTSQKVYLNNILVPVDATTDNTVSTGLVVGGTAGTYSLKKITTLSVGNATGKDAGAWGIPRSYDDTSITQGTSGINDSMWTSTAQVGGLIVGGDYNYVSSDGLAAWNSAFGVGRADAVRGVRLAYVMADAAVTDQITFYSWNGTTYSAANSVELSLGQSYRLPDAADISGYEFKGWTTTRGDYSTFVGKPNQLYTMTQKSISLYPYYTSTAELLGVTVAPTPKDYAYKVTYYTADEVVDGVQHYQSEIKAVYKDANIAAATTAENPVKYANNSWTLDEGSWSWDPGTGLGPFNMFYAAISTGVVDDKALNYDASTKTNPAGKVAYILDPYDLTRALKFRYGDGSYDMSKYNIMLIIPTVYWYSDATNGNLYISNTNTNSYLSSVVNDNMKAYAHTADTDADGDISDETPYPYLAISVYEATKDETSGKLSSVTGQTPRNYGMIDAMRGELDTSVSATYGTYQMWNLYEWTLYKILAQTVIGSKDAQAVIGYGNDTNSNPPQSVPQTTGLGDKAGPYASSGEMRYGKTAYSKLFIENSWGSAWEFVDNTYLGNYALYAGTALTNTLSSSNAKVNGYEYVPTITRFTVLPSMSQNDIRGQSLDSSTWDVPTAGTGKNTSKPLGASSDSVWTASSNKNACLYVGGDWYNTGASAGLSTWYSYQNLSRSSNNVGARLAYLMTADAAVANSEYTIIFNEGGRLTSILNTTKVAITLPVPAPVSGYTFAGWYSDSAKTEYVGPAGSYYTPDSSLATLYAKFVDAPDASGVGDFRVAAFTGANTGAMVQLESASSAGLLDGTLSLGGVYYYDTVDSIRVYGAITYSNVKVGSTPMTPDWVTVTAGDLKDNVTFTLFDSIGERTFYIYYAYAQYEYDLDGTNTMTTVGQYGLIY